MNRTPVLLVSGQELTDQISEALLHKSGTLVVRHRFDGQVGLRSVCIRRGDEPHTSQWPIELMNCCVDCTIRSDLLVLLRRLHRRDDVSRIVVHLPPWLEPEPLCWDINNVDVVVGPGYIDGPAARDVRIEAVITTVATGQWLTDALGADVLDDGRTVAQVVVGQAEFADVLLLSAPDRTTQAVLHRLAPRAQIITGTEQLGSALDALSDSARRGADHDPHEPLLSGEPPLVAEHGVKLVEFQAIRPFHPLRLHRAIDDLLDGVVRLRGRAWLASQPDVVLWIESAGGGLRVGHAGEWLAASAIDEPADPDPERAVLASLRWDEQFGDRHISLTALICGADPEAVTASLSAALLTDDELSRPDLWAHWEDPFGEWHEDPCEGLDKADGAATRDRPDEGDPTGFSRS